MEVDLTAILIFILVLVALWRERINERTLAELIKLLLDKQNEKKEGV